MSDTLVCFNMVPPTVSSATRFTKELVLLLLTVNLNFVDCNNSTIQVTNTLDNQRMTAVDIMTTNVQTAAPAHSSKYQYDEYFDFGIRSTSFLASNLYNKSSSYMGALIWCAAGGCANAAQVGHTAKFLEGFSALGDISDDCYIISDSATCGTASSGSTELDLRVVALSQTKPSLCTHYPTMTYVHYMSLYTSLQDTGMVRDGNRLQVQVRSPTGACSSARPSDQVVAPPYPHPVVFTTITGMSDGGTVNAPTVLGWAQQVPTHACVVGSVCSSSSIHSSLASIVGDKCLMCTGRVGTGMGLLHHHRTAAAHTNRSKHDSFDSIGCSLLYCSCCGERSYFSHLESSLVEVSLHRVARACTTPLVSMATLCGEFKFSVDDHKNRNSKN